MECIESILERCFTKHPGAAQVLICGMWNKWHLFLFLFYKFLHGQNTNEWMNEHKSPSTLENSTCENGQGEIKFFNI